MKLRIVKLQRFSTHDGPGIRTVVFTKGCPLHCAWCHNPETQSFSDQIFFHAASCIGCGACAAVCAQKAHSFSEDGTHSFDVTRCIGCGACASVCAPAAIEAIGTEKETSEILATVLRDRAFYGASGGITLSGGEPMAQPEAALELLSLAKESGITTAIETSGFFSESYLERLASVTDHILWDFKDSDDARHKANTGVSVHPILNNLRRLDAFPCSVTLRCILVRGVNTNAEHYASIASVATSLRRCVGVELIPYHTFGASKSVQLGQKENAHPEWVPSEEEIASAKQTLRALGCTVL